MSLPDIDVLTQLAFSISENKGIFAVLIGSGLSRSAQIPTGWEITLDLVRRLAATRGVTDEPDWAKWYGDQTGEPPSYSHLLEMLGSSPAERRAILHSYIEPTSEDRKEGHKTPTLAHHAIADMVASGHIRVIVTTNFDRLMETALREKGIEPTVVSSVDALNGAEPLTHSKCYLLKIHGDYKDARILNTDDELASYPKEFDDLIDRILDEHGLIICGWSGEWDEALGKAILRTPSRRYPMYWATRSKLRGRANHLATHRGAKVVLINEADGFFRSVRDRVQTLEQARRINPRSVELSVASAKRFLARPEHRIELDELVAQEADLLIQQLSDTRFASQGQWSEDEFRDRVKRYEASTETLARVVGVLGRWGNGSELAVVCDLLQTLRAHAQTQQAGLTIWLNLRTYPALLVVGAYALGLVRAQRWNTLHKLLRFQMTREERQPVAIADCLTPLSWKGNDNNLWRLVEGLNVRKTAFSDHLVDIFANWATSFLGLTADSELVYDRFEMLASLAHFEQNDLQSLQQMKTSRPHQQFAHVLGGRFGWRSLGYSTLIYELQSEPIRAALLDAGFANGSPDLLELFIENLAYLAQRMSW